VRERFGAYAKEVARGLVVRHDHGSQYVSDDFQNELRFLGIASSPSFVRSPAGNGCIERFFRTLKEQLLWTRTFRNAEEVRHAVQLWAALHNEQWLIERHGHRPPAAVRHQFLAMAQAACIRSRNVPGTGCGTGADHHAEVAVCRTRLAFPPLFLRA